MTSVILAASRRSPRWTLLDAPPGTDRARAGSRPRRASRAPASRASGSGSEPRAAGHSRREGRAGGCSRGASRGSAWRELCVGAARVCGRALRSLKRSAAPRRARPPLTPQTRLQQQTAGRPSPQRSPSSAPRNRLPRPGPCATPPPPHLHRHSAPRLASHDKRCSAGARSSCSQWGLQRETGVRAARCGCRRVRPAARRRAAADRARNSLPYLYTSLQNSQPTCLLAAHPPAPCRHRRLLCFSRQRHANHAPFITAADGSRTRGRALAPAPAARARRRAPRRRPAARPQRRPEPLSN
jgi:hypothetical protein